MIININTYISPLVPEQPDIITENCSTANNTVTIAWRCEGDADGYCLELDDGNGGHFKVIIFIKC